MKSSQKKAWPRRMSRKNTTTATPMTRTACQSLTGGSWSVIPPVVRSLLRTVPFPGFAIVLAFFTLHREVQEPAAGGERFVDREILHAIVRADRRVVTVALEIGFD